MKATKFLSLAALALTFAACSSNDDELTQQPAEQPANNNMITITAMLAPKSASAQTRAVSDNGTDIVAAWAENEHIAILYEVSGTKKVADAEITAVDGTTGEATITFAVDGSTPDNTDCTLVYPLSAAKDDHSGVKAYADMLATQDGVLDGDLDVRVGAGTIHIGPASLDVTTQPAAQYSIFKFTTQNISGSAITPTEFTVSDAAGNVITTVTLTASDLYVALPVLSADTYWFNATASGKPYIAKATVSTATSAGKFYSTTVQMATIGDVIKADGKFYAAGTAGALAKITYVGSDAETSTTYNHGLALALSDVSGNQTWCSQTSSTCLTTQYSSESAAKADMAGLANTDALVGHGSHTHNAASAARNYNSGTHPTGTSAWFLPSAGQWDKMATAAGGYGTLKTNAGLQSNVYWSSSERSATHAWSFYSDDGYWPDDDKGYDDLVRACLAF